MTTAAYLGLPTATSRLPSFTVENDQLWTKVWVAAGVEEMIPRPGEILPATIGNHGIHVLRDEQGQLDGGYNAFQQGSCWNIPAQCSNGAKIDCAYVSCGHSRDGDVLRPGISENRLIRQVLGVRPSRRVPISVRTVGSVIFVALPGHDPGPAGEQVASCTAALTSGAHEMGFHSYFHVDALCNWRYIPARVMHALGVVDAGSVTVAVIPPQRVAAGFRDTSDENAGRPRPASVMTGFPNLLVAELPSHRAILTAKPVNLGKTEVTVALYGRGSGPMSWPTVTQTWRNLLENLSAVGDEEQSPVVRWAARRCDVDGAAVP